MTIAERLPTLETDALRSLQVNARRLATEEGKRGQEAEALLPLIEAELSQREPAPKPPVKRTRAPKKA
jgi:hypothetical protein